MGEVVEFRQTKDIELYTVHAIASTELIRYHALSYQDESEDRFVLVSVEPGFLVHRYHSVMVETDDGCLIGYLLDAEVQADNKSCEKIAEDLFSEGYNG